MVAACSFCCCCVNAVPSAYFLSSTSALPVNFSISEMCVEKKQETCLEFFRSDLLNRCKSSLMACILENAVAIVKKMVENMRYAVFILWICYCMDRLLLSHTKRGLGGHHDFPLSFAITWVKSVVKQEKRTKTLFFRSLFLLFSFRNP